MASKLPSLELLTSLVRAERDGQQRHVDAIDAKAGIVLGFAGAVVAVSALRPDGYRVAASCAAVASALVSLLVFFPRRFPVLDVRRARDRYLRSETSFTHVHLLDTQIEMLEQHYEQIRLKARLLKVAICLLVAAVVVSGIGILLEST